MNRVFIPYQMSSPRPTLSDSKRPRKKARPLPQNNLPTPAPPPTFTEFALPSDIITFSRDEKIGNQDSIRRWKKVAEGYKKEAERWKIRALDLAHSQERGIEALEDCWTNLRTTTEGDGNSNSQFAKPKQSGKADDGSWAYYVTSSKRCQMEQKLDDLRGQVKELEINVERSRLESISRFDPYFGSKEVNVEVDDDILFPITRYERYQAKAVECTEFINQLFPGLVTSSSMYNDLDVGFGDTDVDDRIPSTPTSLLSDIFPDLDPVAVVDSDPAPTLAPLSSGISESTFIGTPNSIDTTETVPIDEDPASRFDSVPASRPSFLSSDTTKIPFLDTPNPVVDDDIAPIDECFSNIEIDTVEKETRDERSDRRELEELRNWAKNVLVLLGSNADGEEIEHLEWTWELIKQFQSCIDSQKSID
jgi:hypothetical protein